MSMSVGRPVGPTAPIPNQTQVRVAPPVASEASAQPVSIPQHSKESFGRIGQTVVGKTSETVNPSQGGLQVKQGIDLADGCQLLELGQGLMSSPVVSEEFGKIAVETQTIVSSASDSSEIINNKPPISAVSGAQDLVPVLLTGGPIKPALVDIHTNDLFKDVIAQFKTKTLSEEDDPNQELAIELVNVLATKYGSIPYEVTKTIENLLQNMGSPDKLLQPHVQGLGGTEGAGDQSSGAAGHYVNSPMSSICQLLSNPNIDRSQVFANFSSLSELPDKNINPDLKPAFKAIITGVLQEIAFPESINQHSRSTCVAASVQISLALTNPVKYIQIMYDLVSSPQPAKAQAAPTKTPISRSSFRPTAGKASRATETPATRVIQKINFKSPRGNVIKV